MSSARTFTAVRDCSEALVALEGRRRSRHLRHHSCCVRAASARHLGSSRPITVQRQSRGQQHREGRGGRALEHQAVNPHCQVA